MKEGTNKKRIYMDYAASTPVRNEVMSAMEPYWQDSFANPNSMHTEGKEAKEAIDSARESVAEVFNTNSENIIFTGSGTEANNIAIQGVLKKAIKEGVEKPHFITTKIEHSSVLSVFENMKESGVDVDFCDVNQEGILEVSELEKLITENTALVSVMYVNNEIGTVQPIAEIAQLIQNINKARQSNKILFHVDAAQAPLYLEMDVSELGADFVTVDAQKIYGPKGVGAMYIRDFSELEPVMYGGGQEGGLRPATQATQLIVGLATALKLANKERESEVSRLLEIQDYFFDKISKEISGAIINGSVDHKKRVANNVNISILGLEGDFLLILLDREGVAVSSVSACHSESSEGSHVVYGVTGDKDRALGAVRITLGKDTSKGEVDEFIRRLKKVLENFELQN